MIEVRIMKFHDAHCHLANKDFVKDFDISTFMEKWKNSGLEYVIGVSSNISESYKILEMSKEFKRIIPGIGIHPWKAKTQMKEELKAEFKQIINDNEIIVIGEIGLDHHFIKKEERYPYQEEYFRFFLEQAEKNSLPINIHLKGAEEETSDILTSYKISSENILIHWYSGPKKVFNQFLERDYFFSINPSVLTGSTHIEVLKNAPLNRILTESDGNVKYTIDNVKVTGSPGIIPEVLSKIEEIKNIELDELSVILQKNIRIYANLAGDKI